MSERDDGQVFGGLTKTLALLAAGLMWLASLTFVLEPAAAPEPLWERALISYCVTCYCGWIFYLVVLYARTRHRATSTYQNLLTP
jgi:hypothetical protein